MNDARSTKYKDFMLCVHTPGILGVLKVHEKKLNKPLININILFELNAFTYIIWFFQIFLFENILRNKSIWY